MRYEWMRRGDIVHFSLLGSLFTHSATWKYQIYPTSYVLSTPSLKIKPSQAFYLIGVLLSLNHRNNSYLKFSMAPNYQQNSLPFANILGRN